MPLPSSQTVLSQRGEVCSAPPFWQQARGRIPALFTSSAGERTCVNRLPSQGSRT
ncbi:hypothetical protein P7K49_032592, partial [Saguinus oedipus]